VLRVAYVWFWRRHTNYGGDPLYFHRGANLLVDGHGFINPYAYARHRVVQAADHPPLYLVYLAAWSMVGVRSLTSHLMVSALLGSASVAVAGLAGREIAGPRAGLLGALLVALYPNVWRYDGMLLSETMVVFTVLLAVWMAYRYWHAPSRWRAVAVGAAVGLTALSRSELVMLIVFLVVPLMLLTPHASTKRRLRRLVLGVGASVLVLAPWIGFNLIRFDHTVLLSENIGGTVATSNCRQTYYGDLLGYWYYPCGQDILNQHHIGPYAFNGAADRDQFNGGVTYIRNHLSRVPVVVAARVGRITGVYRADQEWHLDQYLENTTYWVAEWGAYLFYPVALLALAGSIVLYRRGGPVWPLLAPVVTSIAAVALFYAATRFRASAEGALCILAAIAIDGAIAFVTDRRRPALDTPAPTPSAPPSSPATPVEAAP
jgi:4-amino-4-deoxy-L-arabinose transferase-like glycosyltransferase